MQNQKKYILSEEAWSPRATVYVWCSPESQICYKVNSHKTHKTVLGKLEGVLGDKDSLGLFKLLIECRNQGYDLKFGEKAPKEE